MSSIVLIVFSVLVLVSGAPHALSAGLDGVAYIAFGDLRGHLEPCGCDPATDLGGLRRIASFLQRERRAQPELGSFCTGNLLPPKGEGKLKTNFLLEGLANVGIDACLFNATEFDRALEVKAAVSRPPFVLSNLKDPKDLNKIVKPNIETARFIVYGYLSPSKSVSDTRAVSPDLLKRWKDELARSPNKAKILLFSGSDQDLAEIERAKLFDAIISSNTASLDAIVGTAEKDDEKRLSRLTPSVMMTPLGGQGILRGGTARLAQAKSIGELLQGPTDGKTSLDAKPLLAEAKLVTWLDLTYQDDSNLKDLFDRYNGAARAVFAGAAAARTDELKSTPFAGAQACASCHAQAFTRWQASKHAHALATLESKQKQEDPECVACHVLGAHDKGGFVSQSVSPQFANVQCESCHGPALAHSKNPTIRLSAKLAAKAVCTTCHNSQHSPGFNADLYWQRIAH